MILLYHKVAVSSPTPWWVTVDDFNRQMAGLVNKEVVYLSEYDPANEDQVVITFDGVYANVLQYAVPVLEQRGYPFELFVIGNHIGTGNEFDAREPPARFADINELQRMVAAGGRVQWHSASHARLDDGSTDVPKELRVPEGLRRQFPTPHFNWFAYPHGSSDATVALMVANQFEGAVACGDGVASDRYRLPRQEMLPGMQTTKTRVSVIIPNYNYGYFLQDAIDSALRQTLPADEILVIDDCSSDDSREVIQRNAGSVKLCVNDRNLGIVENFRKAVQMTQGDYVVFLGADNRFRPAFIERSKAALDADPGLAVAYGDISLFGPFARILAAQLEKCRRFRIARVFADTATGEEIYHWQFPDGNGDLPELMKEGNCIHGSAMFRRDVYESVGGYRTVEGVPEDRDLFGRIVAQKYRVARIPEPLLDYRQHSPGQANTQLSTSLVLAARSVELYQLRQQMAKVVAERDLLLAEREAALRVDRQTIALWDLARHIKWETTVDGNRRVEDGRTLHIHPNADGDETAAVLVATSVQGHAFFRCRIALLSTESKPVRFWFSVSQGDAVAHQESRELAGGTAEDWQVAFKPLAGECIVILATEMANAQDKTSYAWACFEAPVLETV